MESYRELRERQQKEFNELPLGFAFTMKQFRGMMEEWGLDPEKDQDKLYRIPGGGFLQKKDRDTTKKLPIGIMQSWKRLRSQTRTGQDSCTRCFCMSWITMSTDTPEILNIRWIVWD